MCTGQSWSQSDISLHWEDSFTEGFGLCHWTETGTGLHSLAKLIGSGSSLEHDFMLESPVPSSHLPWAYPFLKAGCYFLVILMTLLHTEQAHCSFLPLPLPPFFLPPHLPSFPFQYLPSHTPAYHCFLCWNVWMYFTVLLYTMRVLGPHRNLLWDYFEIHLPLFCVWF